MGRTTKPAVGAAAAIVVASVALLAATVVVTARQVAKGGNPKAAALQNPVKPTPESIRRGRQEYQRACRHCHGVDALGDGPLAPKNPAPPNLTDDKWEYGSTDGEIFTIISNGVGGNSEMKGVRSEVTATDRWNIVNFLRSIGPKPPT
jgi:mono/diheme cytochrome c family protein